MKSARPIEMPGNQVDHVSRDSAPAEPPALFATKTRRMPSKIPGFQPSSWRPWTEQRMHSFAILTAAASGVDPDHPGAAISRRFDEKRWMEAIDELESWRTSGRGSQRPSKTDGSMPHLPGPWHARMAVVLVAVRPLRRCWKPAACGLAIAPAVVARTAIDPAFA